MPPWLQHLFLGAELLPHLHQRRGVGGAAVVAQDDEADAEGSRELRLPRPQRAFFGRVGRAMMEAVQIFGKQG